jgi:hypothetical protein
MKYAHKAVKTGEKQFDVNCLIDEGNGRVSFYGIETFETLELANAFIAEMASQGRLV